MGLVIKTDIKKRIVDIYLLIISIVAFYLLYSELKYKIIDLYDWLFNLNWYWYLIVGILAAIKPIHTLLTMIKKGDLKWE